MSAGLEPIDRFREAANLTRFQVDALAAIRNYHEAHGKWPIGQDVKERLSEWYDRDVTHGQLYPNLDTLVQSGFAEKVPRTRRSNEYSMNRRGRAFLDVNSRWLAGEVDGNE